MAESSTFLNLETRIQQNWPKANLLDRLKYRLALNNPAKLPTYDSVYPAFFGHDDFIRFCFNKDNPTYEIWTAEYIQKLGSYLIEQSKQYEQPMTIVEVGAGNGRLTHFLQEELKKNGETNIQMIAVDSGKNKIPTNFPVETIDYEDALKKYNPTIVISSWMPMGFDMTKAIRQTPSVKEYILIGEPETSGEENVTWNEEILKKEGFKEQYLKNLTEYQISRTDIPGYDHGSSTTTGTFSFKRNKGI